MVDVEEIRKKFGNYSEKELHFYQLATLEEVKQELKILNGTVEAHSLTLAVHCALWKIFGVSIVVISGLVGAILGGMI